MSWYRGKSISPPPGQVATYSKIEPTGFTVTELNSNTFAIDVQPGSLRLAQFDTQAEAEVALEEFMNDLGFEHIEGDGSS